MDTEIVTNQVYAAYLASYLDREGVSLSRYARAVGASLRTVQRWVSGEITCPQTRQLIKVCRLHGVDFDRPQDLGFTPRRGRDLATVRRHTGPGREDEDMVDLVRRDLLAGTAAVLYGATLVGPVARMIESVPAASVHVGAADVARLVESREHLYVTSHVLGGGAMGPKALLREYRNAVSLLKGTSATEQVRAQAHAVAASVVKQVGWDMHDLGLQDEAKKMWLAALAIAREAEPSVSTVVQAHVLTEMALQADFLGRPQEALDLLAMASGRERTMPPLLRAWLSTVRAVTTAHLGDVAETNRHLGWAQDHINDAADERDKYWNIDQWFDVAEMHGNSGHALTALAMHHAPSRAKAIDALSVAAQSYASGHERLRAMVLNRLARVHAANGDAGETAKAGLSAASAARRLRSPRVTGELLALRPHLRPMRTHSGITDLDHAITSLTRTTT